MDHERQAAADRPAALRERVAATSGDVLAAQVAKLATLFPEAVVEGRVDFDKLKATLGGAAESGPGRFSFTWAGKDDAIGLLQTPTRGTLVPCPDQSVDFGTTANAFIEGENLEVLKLLFKPYFGRVKLIYIDPPYNTGQDFIYPDDFADPLHNYLVQTGQVDDAGNLVSSRVDRAGRVHSGWLSMMYPRLFLARQLLRDDGVICVSIDDHEVHHLRMLMDEVFGAENFVAQFVWNTEGHTDNQYQVKVNHEYVVMYARDIARLELGYVVDPNTREASNLWKGIAENSITKNGPGNPPSDVKLPIGFPCRATSLDLPPSGMADDFFKAIAATGHISRAISDEFSAIYPIRRDRMLVTSGHLSEPCVVYSGWANVNKLKSFIANDCNPVEDEDGNSLEFYLSENGVVYYRRTRPRARNVLSVLRNMGTTEKARSELEAMGIPFQYPKPKELLKYLISVGADDSAIIVDFFAGSGTTAQAVLELNREDGGSRKFILVQLPYPTEIKDFPNIALIAEHRIRVVARQLAETAATLVDAPRSIHEDLGCKMFKLTEPAIRPWLPDDNRDPDAYAERLSFYNDPLSPGAEPGDVVWEVALREGYSLATRLDRRELANGNTVWTASDPATGQRMLVCLDPTVRADLSKQLELTADTLLVVRDVALDDTAAANLALQCRLKTI